VKNTSIRILQGLLTKVHQKVLSTGADESVAFLTASYFDTGEKTVLLGNSIVPASSNDYLRQGPYHLEVSPLYVNRVLNEADNEHDSVIMVHSHPFEQGLPRYSVTDDHGEALTSETISKCLEGNPPVGSILFGQTHLAARIWSGLSKKAVNSPVTVLSGIGLKIRNAADNKIDTPDDFFDRQVKALGQSFQQIFQQLDIGIVGLGGTGSAIAEQLVRMGAQKIRLVDHDRIEASNVSRLYGSTGRDVNEYKVDVVKRHVTAINPNLYTTTLAKSVITKDALKYLSNCDLIFSCLDRHAPRAVLNELSYQCFIPIIDVGVGLQSHSAGPLGGTVRTTLIGPGLPCLVCQEIIRPEIIMAENLSPDEYHARRAEQYTVDLPVNAPSVINFTTMAATFGVLQAVDLLSNTEQETGSTLLFDLSSRETIRTRGTIKPDCVCQKRLGKGFKIPFSVIE
jgi:molybdopterin/thiamine biosynthesis adenylyltransferase